MASSSAQASSSAPATSLATALAALERVSASARQSDSYAPKLRAWLHGLDGAARPIAPPAPDLRVGKEELKAARREAHEAANQHRKVLHTAWKEAGSQRRAAYMNGRPTKKPRTAAATAARLRACGSGAAAAAAASEGGTAEMEIDDALALADEAQRQLEAEAIEMNAELNANLGDAQVAFPTPSPRLDSSLSDSP